MHSAGKSSSVFEIVQSEPWPLGTIVQAGFDIDSKFAMAILRDSLRREMSRRAENTHIYQSRSTGLSCLELVKFAENPLRLAI